MSSFSLKVGCRHYQVFTLTLSLSHFHFHFHFFLLFILFLLESWLSSVNIIKISLSLFHNFHFPFFYFYVLFLLESWLLTLSSFPKLLIKIRFNVCVGVLPDFPENSEIFYFTDLIFVSLYNRKLLINMISFLSRLSLFLI